MSENLAAELDAIAERHEYLTGVNGRMMVHQMKLFNQWLVPGDVLELGPAEGLSTKQISANGRHIHVVDGSELMLEKVKRTVPDVSTHHATFESFTPPQAFNNIILGHVLEHVSNPSALVEKATAWLAPGGRLIASVPNAMSLHRQLGALTKLISAENEVTSTDKSIGHIRVFDPISFRSLFYLPALRIIHFGGFFIKLFSNRQLASLANRETIEGLMALGERYPDIAADIWIVCELRHSEE